MSKKLLNEWQRSYILIRCHIVQHLIWVYIVHCLSHYFREIQMYKKFLPATLMPLYTEYCVFDYRFNGAVSNISDMSIALDKDAAFYPKLLTLFLYLHKNICCGYSLEAPQQGTSIKYPQHVFIGK